MHLGLKDAPALVTGGTSGIGKAIALALAREGARVVIVGTNAERAAQVQAQAAKEYGASIHFFPADVSKYDEVQRVAQEVEAFDGPREILVNCAGIKKDQLLMRITEASWEEVLDVNLKSVYNFCQALVRPMLRARRGAIVNVTSVVGLAGSPGQTSYAAAKAGVIGFSKSLAREVARRGVRVNCLALGWVDTPMTAEVGEERRKEILEAIPMGRTALPDEVAPPALFLCSDASSYMTGQVLVVDGGLVMA